MTQKWRSLVSSLFFIGFSTNYLQANAQIINPNGIIFGPNAQLTIQGSFIATTANSITFPDGSRFSTTNPEGVSLLTIDVPVPIGLQFEGDSSGTIINAGNLATGQNLTLVGDTVVSAGQLLTPIGKIGIITISEGIATQVQLDEQGVYLGEKISLEASLRKDSGLSGNGQVNCSLQ